MTKSDLKAKVFLEGVGGAVSIGFSIVLSPLLRLWYRKWGATQAEVERALPGDELVPHPRTMLNCAVSIHAPADKVWPWLVQLGCKRAGWYSYDLLDNAAIPSAKTILPDFQMLNVGDVVYATADGKIGYPVAVVQPGKSMVLGGTLDTKTGKPADPNDPALVEYFGGTNTFYLDEMGEKMTRLIFRLRLDWNPGFMTTLAYRVFLEPISFVMARKMLLTLKERAENAGK
jgi:hypothetical protein